MRISFVLISLLLVGALSGYAQKHLLVKIANTNHSEAVLHAVRGASLEPLDTANKHLGAFAFSGIEHYPCGVYQVRLGEEISLEVILNNENVSIDTDAKDLMKMAQVHESAENKILFDYYKYAINIRDSVQMIQQQIDALLLENQQQETAATKALDAQLSQLNKAMELYAFEKAMEYPKAFAPKLLVAFQLPSYALFLEQGNEAYPNQDLFYLYHFFDNIDFTDERLLNSKVLFVAINDYIQTFGQQGSTEIYQDITDKVLAKTIVNDKVHRYAINLFIETFETSVYEKVYYYIVEKHLLTCACYHDAEKDYYRQLLAHSKALAIGKTIPNIAMKARDGKLYDLHSYNAEIKLVLFWNSGCEHCHEMLPVVKGAYDAYKEKGLKVFAVAIEESEESWAKDIAQFELEEMLHMSDLMGMGSPLVEEFNVWSTPQIFLVDKNNTIIAKPNTSAELYQGIIEHQQRSNH